jgi:hypothetical protein
VFSPVVRDPQKIPQGKKRAKKMMCCTRVQEVRRTKRGIKPGRARLEDIVAKRYGFPECGALLAAEEGVFPAMAYTLQQ